MMKNIAPKTLLIIFFTISLAACQQRKNFSYDYGHASNNKDPYSYASNDNHPEDQQYYEYEGVSSPDYISGICPEDWIIEREDENTVRLKDTDLEIVLSTGFVPDDYFMPNGFVNDEKYAEHYALIRLSEYDYKINSINDWNSFLTEYYPEVKDFKLLDHQDIPAISPIEFFGVMLGDEIVMIPKYDSVIVACLHAQGSSKNGAEEIFFQIVSKLR